MALTHLVREFIPPAQRPPSGANVGPLIGIELEYENFRPEYLSTQEIQNWTVAGDGSLRNSGVEFVSQPMWRRTEDRLRYIEEIVNLTQCETSERCGLHIHLNMRPYTMGNLFSFITLYALIEPTIYQTYAVGREDNIFGVPLYRNQAQQSACSADILTIRLFAGDLRLRDDFIPRPPDTQMTSTNKYSALNFGGCLMNQGTVEMRQPYCSNDFEAILSWVDFVKRLYQTGVGYDDPLQVLDEYESDGLESLQTSLFGASYDIDPDIQELAEDAAYLVAGHEEPTWQELEWEGPTLEVA